MYVYGLCVCVCVYLRMGKGGCISNSCPDWQRLIGKVAFVIMCPGWNGIRTVSHQPLLNFSSL